MLRGPLHNRGADGRCEECGEPFPCPTGLAIFEAVKRELEDGEHTPLPSGTQAMTSEPYHQATVVFTDAPTREEGVVYRAQCRCRWLGPWQKTQALAEDDATAHEDANNTRGGRWRQRRLQDLERSEALLRAATYLKWFRDRAITPETGPPDDIGEIIVILEQLAVAERQRAIETDDLELAVLPEQPAREIEPTDY